MSGEKSESGDARDLRTTTSVGELAKRERVKSHVRPIQGLHRNGHSGRQAGCVGRRVSPRLEDNGFQLLLALALRGRRFHDGVQRATAGDDAN